MKIIRTKIINAFFFILLTGCTHHFTHFTINDLNYHNPLYGDSHNRVSYTLSIHSNYFMLIRKHHPNTFYGYRGILIKEDRNVYKLENFYHIDSIDYPVSYKNDTIISEGFIVEIDRFIQFRYLIVDGNLYIDTLIKPAVNRPKYNSFHLDEKPKTIQIISITHNLNSLRFFI